MRRGNVLIEAIIGLLMCGILALLLGQFMTVAVEQPEDDLWNQVKKECDLICALKKDLP